VVHHTSTRIRAPLPWAPASGQRWASLAKGAAVKQRKGTRSPAHKHLRVGVVVGAADGLPLQDH
jgi:hypothetical protein